MSRPLGLQRRPEPAVRSENRNTRACQVLSSDALQVVFLHSSLCSAAPEGRPAKISSCAVAGPRPELAGGGCSRTDATARPGALAALAMAAALAPASAQHVRWQTSEYAFDPYQLTAQRLPPEDNTATSTSPGEPPSKGTAAPAVTAAAAPPVKRRPGRQKRTSVLCQVGTVAVQTGGQQRLGNFCCATCRLSAVPLVTLLAPRTLTGAARCRCRGATRSWWTPKSTTGATGSALPTAPCEQGPLGNRAREGRAMRPAVGQRAARCCARSRRAEPSRLPNQLPQALHDN